MAEVWDWKHLRVDGALVVVLHVELKQHMRGRGRRRDRRRRRGGDVSVVGHFEAIEEVGADVAAEHQVGHNIVAAELCTGVLVVLCSLRKGVGEY